MTPETQAKISSTVQSSWFHLIIVGLLFLLLLSISYPSDSGEEDFTFEVSPCRRACGTMTDCPYCCKKGYRGKPVFFEYTGDIEMDRCTRPVKGVEKVKPVEKEVKEIKTVENFTPPVAIAPSCGC
jgi:hypothetical protein